MVLTFLSMVDDRKHVQTVNDREDIVLSFQDNEMKLWILLWKVFTLLSQSAWFELE